MKDFAALIERNLRKKKADSPRKNFKELVFFLVKKGNLSASDLMSMPIPMVLDYADSLSNYYKTKAKSIKKANKR